MLITLDKQPQILSQEHLNLTRNPIHIKYQHLYSELCFLLFSLQLNLNYILVSNIMRYLF